jgi:hypothetical protein
LPEFETELEDIKTNIQEEKAMLWKKLKGDVMRAPYGFSAFAILVSSGAQVAVIFNILLTYAWL